MATKKAKKANAKKEDQSPDQGELEQSQVIPEVTGGDENTVAQDFFIGKIEVEGGFEEDADDDMLLSEIEQREEIDDKKHSSRNSNKEDAGPDYDELMGSPENTATDWALDGEIKDSEEVWELGE